MNLRLNFKKTNDKNKKEENIYVKPFVRFYVSKYLPSIKTVYIDYPDENSNCKMPDYFLHGPKIAIEIKRVIEREYIEQSAGWNKNVERLQKSLKAKGDSALPSGIYLVSLPVSFKVKRNAENKVLNAIVDGIKNHKSEIEVEGIIGSIKIHRCGDKGKNIIFIPDADTGGVHPPAIIHTNISAKIKSANTQLENESRANKRILLLLNAYMFGEVDNFYEALSYSYDALLTYNNIDEIWLQIPKEAAPIMLYARDFLCSYHKNNPRVTTETTFLIEKWFSPLMQLGDEHKDKLFKALKIFLGNKLPHEVFRDIGARVSMVRIGDWLAEKSRYDDIIWLIDRFIKDPDPGLPENYKGNPELNYHQQIIDGKVDFLIASVLGNLAWVIQKLALRQDHISRALNYVTRLASHKNLYVKLQSLYPLLEIARRRQWLQGWGKRPRKAEYKKFHNLVFDIMELVKLNPNYHAIADLLCDIFSYYKDLSTDEANQVLEALQTFEGAGFLFIYFSLYRQSHYKNQQIDFKEDEFRKKLEHLISDTSRENLKIRENIAWHFWKIVNENRSDLEKIKPFIDIFLSQHYQREIYYYIEHIINACIEQYPAICEQWRKLFDEKKEDQ